MYVRIIKPFFDYLGAIILFVLTLPLFLIILILLLIQNKGNPFFIQERNGKDGKVIKVIKFRTMTDAVDDMGNLLPNSARLTPLGKIIRKTSLDELPQLINILKGEMSFIGPRPLPLRYFPYFSENERKRFLVLPGISGLAQVEGRNTINWDHRFLLDVKYVETISFKVDLYIFIKTIINVIRSKNVKVDPTISMMDFDDFRRKF